jgi:hypothetical protein
LDTEEISKREYELLVQNEDITELPTAITQSEEINIASVSGKIKIKSCSLMSKMEVQNIKKLNIPFIGCSPIKENDKYYEFGGSGEVVFVNNSPLFIIDQHCWCQFAQIVISHNDKFIVLEWSRYVSIFDIDNKRCIYYSDCEANDTIEDSLNNNYNCGFGGVSSVTSNKFGLITKHKVWDDNDDEGVVTINWFGDIKTGETIINDLDLCNNNDKVEI